MRQEFGSVRNSGSICRKDGAVENRRDEDGNPVCPVCDNAIRPGANSTRHEDYVLHVDCLPAFLSSEALRIGSQRSQRPAR